MSGADDEALQLLLTEADEYIPVLADGLDEAALGGAPRPDRGPGTTLEAPGGDPNDLPAQRWGVVAPIGEAGDRMLAAVDALVQHRRGQQGAAPKVYRVRPDMDVAAAIRWRSDVYRAEDVPEDERPRYLMLLGDLHEVSIELQHVLAGGHSSVACSAQISRGFVNMRRKSYPRSWGSRPAADGPSSTPQRTAPARWSWDTGD